jgi:hypothetical protein
VFRKFVGAKHSARTKDLQKLCLSECFTQPWDMNRRQSSFECYVLGEASGDAPGFDPHHTDRMLHPYQPNHQAAQCKVNFMENQKHSKTPV